MLVHYKSKEYELVKEVGKTTFLKDLETQEIIDVDTNDVDFINAELIESKDALNYDDMIKTGLYNKESIKLGITFINSLINNQEAMDEIYSDDVNFFIELPNNEGTLNVEIWIDDRE